jgi:hypothetical protein
MSVSYIVLICYDRDTWPAAGEGEMYDVFETALWWRLGFVSRVIAGVGSMCCLTVSSVIVGHTRPLAILIDNNKKQGWA